MSIEVRTRVKCDGPKCFEHVHPTTADRDGWKVDGDKHYCRRCATGVCAGRVGTRPDWMGVDQWDACYCQLWAGHEGRCSCSHEDLGRVVAAAHEVFKWEGVMLWMGAPNRLLNNATPMQFVEAGDAQRVLDVIDMLASGAVL